MIGIIVVFPKADLAKSIRGVLVRSGFNVYASCTNGAQAVARMRELDSGIVVCAYKMGDMMYDTLAEYMPEYFRMVLVSSNVYLPDGEDARVVSLPTPLKVGRLVETLRYMEDSLARRIRQDKKKPKVRSEEEKRLIAEAKSRIMETENMSEEEAHKFMQKTCMDRGKSLVEFAREVLKERLV